MKHVRLALSAIAAAAMLAPAAALSSPSLEGVLGATDWLNGRPTHADVRGKVVLVDFYTFECINCKHVEPNLRALYKTTSRADLEIISVHSPETPYEADRDHLIASLAQQGVAWPVAVDDDFRIWHAYGVDAWPTQLIFDRHGILAQTIVGEGQDGDVDATIRRLIAAM